MSDENKNVVEEKQQDDKVQVNRKVILFKYITYVVLFILCIVLKNTVGSSEFILGDFGSIVPLLLQVVSIMGLKWVPLFCIGGIIITRFENKFKDFSNNFLTVVIIVAVTSIGLLLII